MSLADSSSGSPSVNILLGADYCFSVLRGSVEKLRDHFYLSDTILGYTVVAKVE